MAIIDAPSWDINGEKVFAYLYPEKNLSSNAVLNVTHSQEAIFLIDGKIQKIYQEGRYTLDTPNIPIFRKLFGIPFGGKNPLMASLWFINKSDILQINCQTNMFLVKDTSFPHGCPTIALVNYGLHVANAEKFFTHLVNYQSPYYASHINASLSGRIQHEISSKIAQYADAHNLSLAEINARRSLLTGEMKGVLTSFVDKYGIEVVDLNIADIRIDTSDEGMKAASGFGFDPNTYSQNRMLDIQEKALENIASGSGGLMGAFVAMSMMNNMRPGSPVYTASSVAQPSSAPAQSPTKGVLIHDVYCSNCANKYPSNMKFCPKCGNQYRPCPSCSSDNSPTAKRCVNCGSPLLQENIEICPNCKNMVPPGSTFCPSCGRPLNEDRCSQCNTPLHGATFCPNCGSKNK